MSTSNASAATSSAVGYVPSTTKSLASNVNLSSTDFLKVMVAALKQQDPQSPTDPTSYYQQVMQMSTYQATLNQEANTSKLVNQNNLSLVGKGVVYADPNNNGAQTVGIVTQIDFSATGAKATVKNPSTGALNGPFDVGYISTIQESPTWTTPTIP